MEVECEQIDCLCESFFAQEEFSLDQYSSCKYHTYAIIDKNLISFEVVFASGASLVLFVLAFFFVGMPPRRAYPRPSINGVSVLETLWVAAHSRTIREHMTDVEEPSLDNLRKAGMFMIRLGDIYASRVLVPDSESEAFLE
jgi:uncharacterized protein YjeT (DUF2065 family)